MLRLFTVSSQTLVLVPIVECLRMEAVKRFCGCQCCQLKILAGHGHGCNPALFASFAVGVASARCTRSDSESRTTGKSGEWNYGDVRRTLKHARFLCQMTCTTKQQWNCKPCAEPYAWTACVNSTQNLPEKV